jgi:hypothetical protein
MAFDASSTSPCGLLNTTSYSDIWIPDTATTSAYSNIATSGTTKSFKDILDTYTGTRTLTATTLATPNSTSSAKLIRFMSGANFSQVQQILLGTSTTRKTIIDTYFAGTKNGYLTLIGANSITDTQIWNPSDLNSTTGQPISNPSSVLGKLLGERTLLNQQDIYFPSQLQAQPNPPSPGDSSLIYLYKVQQESRLSTDQQTRLTELENRNLKFFAGFYAEYCFYRSRYVWLLKQYFEVYKTTATNYTAKLSGSPEMYLFNNNGTAQNQYSGNSINQADLLKGIAYHLAIINTRLIDMRRLLSAINNYYQRIFTTIQTNINDASLVGSNSDVVTTINSLNASSLESKKYLSEAEFQKGVLEYNAQKNRYANNLLALYSFLNISALAIIIHLYQS